MLLDLTAPSAAERYDAAERRFTGPIPPALLASIAAQRAAERARPAAERLALLIASQKRWIATCRACFAASMAERREAYAALAAAFDGRSARAVENAHRARDRAEAAAKHDLEFYRGAKELLARFESGWGL